VLSHLCEYRTLFMFLLGHYPKTLCFLAGGYVVVDEKLPRFVVPDLTDFKVIGRICFWFT
jgi:hypothetical protein